MNQKITLIGGTERSDGESYPPDWPCQCGHVLADHGASKDFSIVQSMCKVKPLNIGSDWADACVQFDPVDNLTYVEQIAKTKEVIK